MATGETGAGTNSGEIKDVWIGEAGQAEAITAPTHRAGEADTPGEGG